MSVVAADLRHSENGGTDLLPKIRRKRPEQWNKTLLRSYGLLPIELMEYDVCLDAGVPLVALGSGWWAPAWVYLALNTWGKRSKAGTVRWLKEHMVCQKRQVTTVTEALMLCKSERTSWREPAKVWLDQQRTCANTCPYL